MEEHNSHRDVQQQITISGVTQHIHPDLHLYTYTHRYVQYSQRGTGGKRARALLKEMCY